MGKAVSKAAAWNGSDPAQRAGKGKNPQCLQSGTPGTKAPKGHPSPPSVKGSRCEMASLHWQLDWMNIPWRHNSGHGCVSRRLTHSVHDTVPGDGVLY